MAAYMSAGVIGKNYEAAEKILNNQIEQAKKQFEYSVSQLKKERDGVLNESYIGRRISERDLVAMANAMGLHGGLSETSAVRLRNNYENSRNSINSGYVDNYGTLSLRHAGELSELRAKIAAAKMQAEAEILEAQARAAATAAAAASSRGRAATRKADDEESVTTVPVKKIVTRSSGGTHKTQMRM